VDEIASYLKVKCDQCVAERTPSTVRFEVQAAYLVRFFDADGEYHEHEHRPMTHSYLCSNGHRWEDTFPQPCWTCNDPISSLMNELFKPNTDTK
jgi:hypothetical protein